MPNSTKLSLEDVLQNWNAESLDTLKEIGEEIHIRKGLQLREIDLYYLIKGECALCMESEFGRDVAIIHFTPGRLLNFLPCLIKFYQHSDNISPRLKSVPDFYVKTLSDSTLLQIDHARFLEKYFFSLPLHSLIIRSLIANYSELYSNTFNMRELPAWQRIAGQLLDNMSETPPHILKRHITYGEMAAYLSLHPVTVAKIFKALASCGVIKKQRGQIQITDPERLKNIFEGAEQLFYKKRCQKKDNED